MSIRNNFALLFVVFSCLMAHTNRVVNGEDPRIEDSPYVVSLHYYKRYYCMGSLIDMATVITAAHCVRDLRTEEMSVSAGVTSLSDLTKGAGQTRNVACADYPDGYDSITLDMDIGVIRLTEPFQQDLKVNEIPLCRDELKPDTPMKIFGWGVAYPGQSCSSDKLQTTSVSVVPKEECEALYKDEICITESMICAERTSSDPYRSESGTAGVVNGQLCAVASRVKTSWQKSDLGIRVYTTIFNDKVKAYLNKALQRTVFDLQI